MGEMPLASFKRRDINLNSSTSPSVSEHEINNLTQEVISGVGRTKKEWGLGDQSYTSQQAGTSTNTEQSARFLET